MPAPEQSRNTSSTGRYRVLLAIKSLGYGGAERLVADLVAASTSPSFEYEVAYILGRRGCPGRHHRLRRHPRALPRGRRAIWTCGGWLDFRRLLLDGSFDVVHFHLPYTAALGRLVVATLPRGRRPITVYTEHSLWNKVAVLVKLLNRATVRFDRALVAVSDAAYDSLPARAAVPGPRGGPRRRPVTVGGPGRPPPADPPGGAGRARHPAGERCSW